MEEFAGFMFWLLLFMSLFGFLGWKIGEAKGNAKYGLIVGALLGPIGILVMLVVASSPRCPECGGAIPLNVRKCKHCGSAITAN